MLFEEDRKDGNRRPKRHSLSILLGNLLLRSALGTACYIGPCPKYTVRDTSGEKARNPPGRLRQAGMGRC